MFLIRKEQMMAFRVACSQQFESDMVEHLSDFAPELARVAGKSGLQMAVHRGVKRAAEYGLTNRGPVRLYLELICSLGSEFDTDPQYPWVRVALTGPEHTEQTRRASRLYRAAMQYFDEVAGPDNVHAAAALTRARDINWPAVSDSGNLMEEILSGFRICYPQKQQHIGDTGLRVLIQQALELADKHGLRSDQSRALISALLFGFGHGVLDDPLYPWVGSVLRDSLVSDPEDRAARLHDRVRAYIKHIQL